MRDGDDLVTVVDVPAPLAALGGDAAASPTLDGPRDVEIDAGHAAGRDHHAARAGDAASCGARPPRRPARRRQRRHPAQADQRAARAARAARRDARRGQPAARTRASSSQAQARLSELVIRLGVRVAPRATPSSSSPSCSSSRRGGVEERDARRGHRRVRGLRRRRASCPRSRRSQAAAGTRSSRSSRSEVADDWADRWREFHQPSRSAGACSCARRGRRRPTSRRSSTSSSIPARRSAPARIRRRQLCLELLLDLEPAGAFMDLGCGSGVLAIAAARLGLERRCAGVDHDPLSVDRDARERRGQRRRGRAPGASTCCATARRPARRPSPPTCCARCCWRVARAGFDGPAPRAHHRQRPAAPPRPTRSRRRSPRAPACSERARLEEGDWAALLLRRSRLPRPPRGRPGTAPCRRCGWTRCRPAPGRAPR